MTKFCFPCFSELSPRTKTALITLLLAITLLSTFILVILFQESPADVTYASVISENIAKIPIKSMKADYDVTLSDFLLLTDGYEENAPDVSCFFSETDEGGWAEINLISWSFVSHVRILGQSINGFLYQGIQVSLCDRKAGNCSFCGTSGPMDSGWWAQVNCSNGSREANIVKLMRPSRRLEFCEVEVYGKMMVETSVRSVPISYGRSLSADGSILSTDVLRTHDSRHGTSLSFGCFASVEGGKAWASFSIPWSLITHVQLLNSAVASENKMEGLFVFVCEYGTNRCFPCGVMLSADAATWASVYCTGGMILGNEVQLRHPYERLLFCEIEIFGQTEGIDVSHLTSKLPILGASDLRAEDYVQQTFDNNLGTAGSYCISIDPFISGDIVYDLEWSQVKYVDILNADNFRADDSIELEGVVVEVCNSVHDTCTECGIVSATAASSWHTVFCPHPGLQGNRIKISKWGFAAFCEIVIFGVKIERVQ